MEKTALNKLLATSLNGVIYDIWSIVQFNIESKGVHKSRNLCKSYYKTYFTTEKFLAQFMIYTY